MLLDISVCFYFFQPSRHPIMCSFLRFCIEIQLSAKVKFSLESTIIIEQSNICLQVFVSRSREMSKSSDRK